GAPLRHAEVGGWQVGVEPQRQAHLPVCRLGCTTQPSQPQLDEEDRDEAGVDGQPGQEAVDQTLAAGRLYSRRPTLLQALREEDAEQRQDADDAADAGLR